MRVRHRFGADGARVMVVTVAAVAVSVWITTIGLRTLPGGLSIVYLVVGAAGTLLSATGLVLTAGRMASRRVVLELDEHGVRVPALWPLPTARDRLLPWPEVASAVVWNRPRPRGPRGVVVAFLPTPEGATRTEPRPSAELAALPGGNPPGFPTTRWSVQMNLSWDTGLDEVIANLRERGLPVTDARKR